MATTHYDTVYTTSGVADTVFTRGLNTNWTAIKSSFSGTSYPSNDVAGMLHMRTGVTGPGLRVRNSDDTAWHKVLTATASQKIPVYRNDTDEGWLIDATSATDRVIALKGGSGAYNANGGSNAGTAWSSLASHTHSMSHTHSHNHDWYTSISSGDDRIFNSGGSQVNLNNVYVSHSKNNIEWGIQINSDVNQEWLPSAYTNNDSTAASSSNTGAASTTEARVAAALCTLQYPDLT